MTKLLFVSLLLATSAHAQDIACPKFYPSDDTPLSEVPYQHTGKGILKKQALSGAYWMAGEINDTFGEMEGASDKVKNGVDIAVPAFAKWFVCWYGGGRAVAWWEQIKPETLKNKACKIQIRNRNGRDPMDIKLVCRCG